jgi:peptide deformylase
MTTEVAEGPKNYLGLDKNSILKYPDPLLLRVSDVVTENGNDIPSTNRYIYELGQSMAWLMNKLNALGVAAPQVGRLRRVISVRTRFGYEPTRTRLDKTVLQPALSSNHYRIMVNPEILEKSKETYTSIEGCLSIPDKLYRVTRHRQVRLTYLEPVLLLPETDNSEVVLTRMYADAVELFAAVVQHEIDHLDGVLINSRGV